MDKGKVEAITSWPLPSSIKELQRFLGFSNFYRRFISNYSTITSPLTDFLKGKAKSLAWNPNATEAQEAEAQRQKLKRAFTSAPLLVHPNPRLPFVVEVYASTTGVGAVLFQQQGTPPKLHPCAFFSRKLSPAERNYDMGNRELLAIKLALEKWRHWLEGAAHPFLVLTDHKNLQYLREAKRLNPRQARWALFFTRFQFKISYRPGPRNVKADALSRIHTPEEDSGKPEGILPAEIITSPIQWTSPPVASTTPPANPPGCPPDHQYVPRTQRTPLIHTTHTSLGTGHPGANATLSLLRDRFWWPNMARDVRRFVQGCPNCAISKSSCHLPVGKILPLPIPNRPWSHLVVDFITDLPVSDGNTCISRLALNRGSRLDFTPRPTLFFFLPACFCCLVSSIYWRDSFCTALQTRKLWIWSTGLSARLIPSSQREVWVLGNLFVLTGRSRPDIRGMRGRGGKSCVWRLFPLRTLRISTFSPPW